MTAVERALMSLLAAQYGVIARRQALGRGTTRKVIETRLRNGYWTRKLPGTYVLAGAPRSWQQELMSACLWADGCASHRSAAALLDLPSSGRPVVEISTHVCLSAPGIIVHRTPEMVSPWITEVAGIPTTTIPRTLVDLCAVVAPGKVEEALDASIARRLNSAENQWRCMNRMGTRGRCGTARLRAFVAERMELGVPHSVAETRFLRLIRRSRLPSPRLQLEVRDEDFVARLDAAWPEIRLGIEVDGWRWHSSKAARLRDARRQNRLERLG